MPPEPPGAPLAPGMSSCAIVSHPGSLWVIFDPSGVSNRGVSLLCIAVHCSALQCNFAIFAFFCVFCVFFSAFSPKQFVQKLSHIIFAYDKVSSESK